MPAETRPGRRWACVCGDGQDKVVPRVVVEWWWSGGEARRRRRWWRVRLWRVERPGWWAEVGATLCAPITPSRTVGVNFSEEGSFLPKGTKLFRWYPESADNRAFVCCSIARLIRATNGVAMAGPWIHSTRCGPHWRDLGGRPAVRTNRVLVLSSVGYPVGSATLQPSRAKLT